MEWEQLRVTLRAWPRLDRLALAREAGVPDNTLMKAVYGYTANPRIRTVEAIMRAYRARNAPR